MNNIFQPSFPKVLIVEDSSADAALIKNKVQSLVPATRIITAPSLMEAFDIIKTENINLILLDLNLPESFGANTVKEAKRFTKNISIIAVTGMDEDIIEQEAKAYGVEAFVKKEDIDGTTFKGILKRYLSE